MSPDDYLARKDAAGARLTTLLDPQTDQERRYVKWLLGFDLDTIDTIAGMIERRLTG